MEEIYARRAATPLGWAITRRDMAQHQRRAHYSSRLEANSAYAFPVWQYRQPAQSQLNSSSGHATIAIPTIRYWLQPILQMQVACSAYSSYASKYAFRAVCFRRRECSTCPDMFPIHMLTVVFISVTYIKSVSLCVQLSVGNHPVSHTDVPLLLPLSVCLRRFKSATQFIPKIVISESKMTDQSFKGKGKVTDWDDNQSISLSEYHYSPVPRSTPLETSGDLTQASYYFNNNNYSFETNGSEQACYADTLSRSPGTTTENTYGGDSTYHMNPTDLAHDDVNWDAMSLVSVFTDVTAQMSVFSSSSRSSSRASAAPSRISNVDTHINRQGPTRQRYQLPCELRRLGCNQVFNGDEEMEWMDHTETHLEGSFPSKLKCCKSSCLRDPRPPRLKNGGKKRINRGVHD